MSCRVTTFSFNVSGASLVSALAILRVKLSLRRLPTMTTTLFGVAMGCPFLKRNRRPRRNPAGRKMQVHEIAFAALPEEERLLRGGRSPGSAREHATSKL